MNQKFNIQNFYVLLKKDTFCVFEDFSLLRLQATKFGPLDP